MDADIVTRLREKYSGQLPICTEAADEIERLRAILNNMSERNQQQNTQQFKVIRALEADRDQWRTTAQQAMDNTDKALAVIELHKAMKAATQ